MRFARRSALLSLLLVLCFVGGASAATANVSMIDNVFSPKTVTIKAGDRVTWTNNGTIAHTSTGDAPLSLWDSGSVAVGDSFARTFTAGGKYRYHCTFHQSIGMVGTVSVTIKASPRSGPAGTVFTITVASVDTPLPWHYDLRKKVPGDPVFRPLFSIRTKSFTFDSTGLPTGKYQFISRLRRSDTMAHTQFSVPTTITVTA